MIAMLRRRLMSDMAKAKKHSNGNGECRDNFWFPGTSGFEDVGAGFYPESRGLCTYCVIECCDSWHLGFHGL